MVHRGPIKWPISVNSSKTSHFDLHYYELDEKRYAVATLGDLNEQPVPLRIESACVFGHIFRGKKCDCGDQFELALERVISRGHGVLIFAIDDDARGHGIEMHFKLYELRQHEGQMDEEAIFDDLGMDLDIRDYGHVIDILNEFSIESVELMTNNPERIEVLQENGITVTERWPLETEITVHNEKLLLQEKKWLDYDTSYQTHDERTREFVDRLHRLDSDYGVLITEDHTDVVYSAVGDTPQEVEVPTDAEGFLTVYTNSPTQSIPFGIDKTIVVTDTEEYEWREQPTDPTRVSQ